MSLFGTPGTGVGQSGGFNIGSSPFGTGGIFSTPQAGGSGFNAGSTPSIFGSSSGAGMFGSTASAFGQSSGLQGFGQSTPAFGQTTPAFGQTSAFGQSASAFVQCTPSYFGQTTPSIFGQTPQPGAQQSSLFGGQSTLYGQNQPSPFGQTQQMNPFGQAQSSMFGTPQQNMFQSSQLTTQMAPVAPVVIPLPDREVQAFVDAYKEESTRFAFKHLLLSVTDPSLRIKPVGVSDIMWAEAMSKLDGMESADRERLWPELVHGFKDLSRRLKLQDDAIASDVQRLRAAEANVKLLHRHFDTDTLPWIQRLRQKEQEMQRRLLKMMRVVEGLESKGLRMPLTRGEAKLGEQLRALTHQLEGVGADLPRRVDTLLSRSRMQEGLGQGSTMVLLGAGKIEEQSLSDMHEVLRQQTEAIAHLTGVLKRDIRDMEIVVLEDMDLHLKGDTVGRGFIRNSIGESSKFRTPLRNTPLTFGP